MSTCTIIVTVQDFAVQHIAESLVLLDELDEYRVGKVQCLTIILITKTMKYNVWIKVCLTIIMHISL